MAGTAVPAAPPPGFFPSIALIRAVAALIVVYDHFLGIWPERNKVAFAPAQFVERWVFEPLGLMQHGGAFAVALFFMVSGFIIVCVGVRESPRTFAIRRALRIYPPLWVSILLLLAAFIPALALSDSPGLRGFQINEVLAKENPRSLRAGGDVARQLSDRTPAVNGVAWTLIVEVLFYLCDICAAAAPAVAAASRDRRGVRGPRPLAGRGQDATRWCS